MKIGDKVRWTSSNTTKEGEIVAIVPAGTLPREIGFPKLSDTGLPRDHESYIVAGRGTKYGFGGAAYPSTGPKFTLWPRVSLLRVVS